MICNKCGKEITDNSVFCEYCGAKVEEVHTDSNAGEQSIKKGNKKGLKIGIIVGIILALALAGVGITLILKKGGSDSEIGGLPKAKTPQEEALNNYFDAIKSFDTDAFMEACYPQELIGKDSLKRGSVAGYVDVYGGLGLSRGLVDESVFYMPSFSDGHLAVVAESYPDVGSGLFFDLALAEGDEKKAEEYKQAHEEYVELAQSDDGAKTLLKDLKITYNMVGMDKFNDCTVYNIIENENVDADYINKLINGYDNDVVNVSADDIYVARIQVEWAYGDKLYGWDEDWWNDSDFVDWVAMHNITPRNTYESIIEEYKNREYVMFIYRYNGEWYVCPDTLVRALNFRVE